MTRNWRRPTREGSVTAIREARFALRVGILPSRGEFRLSAALTGPSLPPTGGRGRLPPPQGGGGQLRHKRSESIREYEFLE